MGFIVGYVDYENVCGQNTYFLCKNCVISTHQIVFCGHTLVYDVHESHKNNPISNFTRKRKGITSPFQNDENPRGRTATDMEAELVA